MAHFAELDVDNKVIRVLVFSNEDINNHGGDLSVQAEQWVENSTPHIEGGVSWKQTSYNGNFRKKYAGYGDIFNSELNMFVGEQPDGPGWTLDSNGDWQPGNTYPTITTYEVDGKQFSVDISWDEDSLSWKGVKWKIDENTILTWDTQTQQWN
jgi:hypothetical protein